MSSLNSKPNFTSAVAKSASGNCTVTVEEVENNNSVKANSRTKLAPWPVGKVTVSDPLKGQLEVTTTTEATPSGGPDKQQCVVGSLTDFEEADFDHLLWAASRPRYNRSTSESNVNAPADATDGRQTSVAAKSLSSSSQKLLSGYFREAESRINLEDSYAGEKVKYRSRPFGGTVPRRRSALIDRDRNQCSARSEHETMSLSSAATALHQRQQAIQQCGMSNAPLMKQHVADVDAPIDVFNSSAFSTAKPYKEEADFSRFWHQEEEEKEKGEEAEESVAEAVKQYSYKQLSNVRCVSPSNKTIELQSLDGEDEDGVLGQTGAGEEDEHGSAKKRHAKKLKKDSYNLQDSLADSVPHEVLSQFPPSTVFLPRGEGGQYRGSFLPSYNSANTNNSMSMRGKRHNDWQPKPRANRTKGPQPVCAEQIEGYRGAESLDAIIDYVEGRGGGNQQQQLKSSNPTSPQSGVQQQSKKKKAGRSSSLQMQNAPNHAVSSGESTASAEGDRSAGEEHLNQDQEAETTLVDGEVTLAVTPNANATTDSSVTTSGPADEDEADVEEASREIVIAEGRTLDLNDDRLYLKDDDPLPSTTPTPSLDGEFQVVQSKKKERQRTKKLTPRYSLDQQQAALAGRARAVRAVTPPLTVSSPASSAVSPPQSATKGGPSHLQYGGGPFGSRGVRGGPKFGNAPPKANTAEHRVRRNSGPPVDDAASFPPLSVVVLSNADASDTMEYAKSEGGEASEHKPSWASVAGGSTRGGPKVGGSSSSASSTTAPSPAPNTANANIEEPAAKNEHLLVVELAREEELLEASKIVEAEVAPPPPAKVELDCCEATTNVEIFGSPPTGEPAVDVSFGFDESLPENCWTGVGTTEQDGDGFVLMTGADGQEIRIFHPQQLAQQSGLLAPMLQASNEHVRLLHVMTNDWADFLNDEPYHLSDIQERILSTKCRSGNNTGTDAGNKTG